jgi:hypothetical protein
MIFGSMIGTRALISIEKAIGYQQLCLETLVLIFGENETIYLLAFVF